MIFAPQIFNLCEGSLEALIPARGQCPALPDPDEPHQVAPGVEAELARQQLRHVLTKLAVAQVQHLQPGTTARQPRHWNVQFMFRVSQFCPLLTLISTGRRRWR